MGARFNGNAKALIAGQGQGLICTGRFGGDEFSIGSINLAFDADVNIVLNLNLNIFCGRHRKHAHGGNGVVKNGVLQFYPSHIGKHAIGFTPRSDQVKDALFIKFSLNAFVVAPALFCGFDKRVIDDRLSLFQYLIIAVFAVAVDKECAGSGKCLLPEKTEVTTIDGSSGSLSLLGSAPAAATAG